MPDAKLLHSLALGPDLEMIDIHVFIQQIFIKLLLRATHDIRTWIQSSQIQWGKELFFFSLLSS